MQQCNNQKIVVIMENEKKERKKNYRRKKVTDSSSLSQLLGGQDVWREGAMLTWPRLGMHLAIRNSCDFGVLS